MRAFKGLLTEASSLVAREGSSPECTAWQAVHDQLNVAMVSLKRRAEMEQRWHSGYCELCERWTCEAFWCYQGWLCSGCIVVQQGVYSDTPPPEAGSEPFVGRWLATDCEGTTDSDQIIMISVEGSMLRVQFNQWVGGMSRNGNDITIDWESQDDEIWISEGWLYGHVIDWPKSGSRWARIWSRDEE